MFGMRYPVDAPMTPAVGRGTPDTALPATVHLAPVEIQMLMRVGGGGGGAGGGVLL